MAIGAESEIAGLRSDWWKESVVYQIYPRSFCDSNGDGIGDLPGITSKLDHLKLLGVDVVWLSPIYQSPNDDNGYDISDYVSVMTEFGTMPDFDEMLAAMHERGIKLMMDLVVNHTSDEHEWFVESSSSKDNPKRDYYIWRPPSVDGGPPNNWESFFSGSTWEFHEQTGEYYLHYFTRKQPDLNWENPAVREEVWKLMRFWLDKGVDGFRMDVINLISKVPGLPNAAVVKEGFLQPAFHLFANGPRLMEFLGEMRHKVLAHYDTITVGETPMVKPSHGVALTNEQTGPLNMIFQFDHMSADCGSWKWDVRDLDVQKLQRIMGDWQTKLEGKGWNSLYLNNHDQPRSVSRFGNDTTYRVASAKMLATWLHMHQGTPYVYQGEEIGMTNVKFASIDEYKDVETLNWYNDRVLGHGDSVESVMSSIYARGRDNARTPMQWSGDVQGGFTSGRPWIAMNPRFNEINAFESVADPESIFHYYRQLIALRGKHPILVHGTYARIETTHPSVAAYTRSLATEQWLVVCNFSEEPRMFEWPPTLDVSGAELIIGNYPSQPIERNVSWRPWEGAVYRVF
jgi:oligo-1,6-glucosidase